MRKVAPFEILQGDVLDVISTINDNSIDCIVTSPPYYRKVDYGHPGQWGMEHRVEDYLQKMTLLVSELYRVLKSTGTCWINIGDSYVSNSSDDYSSTRKERGCNRRCNQKNMRRGTLLLIPDRLRIICQDVGFIVRNNLIWQKENPKPTSGKNRFQGSYEYILFLTKSEPGKYYFNYKAIEKSPSQGTIERRRRAGDDDLYRPVLETDIWSLYRNRVNIDHPAMFPIQIPLKCISVGCPPGGLVLDPFSGAGNTEQAALQLGRRYIGIELVPEYAEKSKKVLIEIARQGRLFK